MINHLPCISILGVPVYGPSQEQAVDLLVQMATSTQPHHVSPVNPELVMAARDNPLFREVLANATLTLPDGYGLLWASRFFGQPLPERVTGVDTVDLLAARAAKCGLSIFLLGAAPGVAEKAASVLRARHSGLVIAGTYSGSPAAREEDSICQRIEQARPSILLVAFGSPDQDLWISRTQPRLRVPLAMSVGGSLDFIAGIARRAPAWMQRASLEWLYRLIREPHRWRRQLRLPRFVFAVLSQKILP